MSYHDDLMGRIGAAKTCEDLAGCTDAAGAYSKLLSSLSTQIETLTILAVPPTTPATLLIWAGKMCQQFTSQINAATTQVEQLGTQQGAANAAIAAKAAEIGC